MGDNLNFSLSFCVCKGLVTKFQGVFSTTYAFNFYI